MKKIYKIWISGFIATSIISTAVITPIEITKNNDSNLSAINSDDKTNIISKDNISRNNSFNINEISTKWSNNTPSEHLISNDFNEILNYNKNLKNNKENQHFSYIDNVLLALKTTNKESSKMMSQLSIQLNKLTTSQQNKVKNQMLKMYNLTSREKITYKNISTILTGFTTSSNIKKVNAVLLKYQTEAAKHVLNNKDNVSFILMHAQFNYASNCQTTIGQLINNLNDVSTAFAWTSAAAAIFAAGQYIAAAFDFGFSTPWALGATAISVITGAVSACCGLAASHYQSEANQLPKGFQTGLSEFCNIYPLGMFPAQLIELITTATITISTFSWVFPVATAIVDIAIAILDTFNTIND